MKLVSCSKTHSHGNREQRVEGGDGGPITEAKEVGGRNKSRGGGGFGMLR